jgi:hypothetical protein
MGEQALADSVGVQPATCMKSLVTFTTVVLVGPAATNAATICLLYAQRGLTLRGFMMSDWMV